MLRRAVRSYLLFFTPVHAGATVPHAERLLVCCPEWPAKPDDPALTVIALTADHVASNPRVTLGVEGLANTPGRRGANVLLTRLRAQVIAGQLQSDGLLMHGFRASDNAQFATPRCQRENRRPQINFSGP